jgi:hypothetical protein
MQGAATGRSPALFWGRTLPGPSLLGPSTTPRIDSIVQIRQRMDCCSLGLGSPDLTAEGLLCVEQTRQSNLPEILEK